MVVDGLRVPARVEGDYLELGLGDRFEARFWPGVNLGSSIPGHHPGEVAATREDYDRWLPAMGDLGVRAVRVYTILRPDFYDALASYNTAHPDTPIYVIQGVWLPDEERLLEVHDVFDEQVSAGFRDEIDRLVAVVHGDADLPRRPGHAAGRYRSDISRWLLAWSIGIEWDPEATFHSDRLNANRPPHRGPYLESTAEASPMETWLASMLDHLASLEASRGWSRPVTFTNWAPTDPLDHPNEPFPDDDLVGVDAMHIRATDAWPGGFFASYHVYPYYPKFIALEPAFQRYRRPSDGERDSYAGYLHALRAHHDGQAVMITEFGVPTGLGIAHRGPLGRDQGGHAEREAGDIEAEMLRIIGDEGYAGAILFAWLDEWAKTTWNVDGTELPLERRALWQNVLNNETHFGIMAAEPGSEPLVTLDGRADEWSANGSQVIAESRGPVREVRAVFDEAYLYLLLRFDQPEAWRRRTYSVGFDVHPEGNGGLPLRPGVHPEADVAVELGLGDEARIRIAAWRDPFRIRYGLGEGRFEVSPRALRPGSGDWVTPRLVIDFPYTVPATGERTEAQFVDLGLMPWGPWIPGDDDSDVRKLVVGSGRTLEMRIPWAMLGFSDPSSRRILLPSPDGEHSTLTVDGIGIGVTMEDGEHLDAGRFRWERWNAPRWHERRKDGWDAVAAAMESGSQIR